MESLSPVACSRRLITTVETRVRIGLILLDVGALRHELAPFRSCHHRENCAPA